MSEKYGLSTASRQLYRFTQVGYFIIKLGRSNILTVRVLADQTTADVFHRWRGGLKKAIGTLLAWHPGVGLILDWYHVVTKVKTAFSLALRGREIRHRHLRNVLPLLWYGLVEQAVVQIESIP